MVCGGEEERKRKGRKIYWRRKKWRRTKVEYRTVFIGSLSNTILWIVSARWVLPNPHYLFLCPKIVEMGNTPPPLQKKSAKEYYASPEFAKIYPNYLYAYDMNRMRDETGNIMMLNLENAENVCFGFTINPLPYV